jgi:hypothetical protein
MISGTEHNKIFVQTRAENIEIEVVPFAFGFLIGRFIPLEEARQKRYFSC